MEIKSDLGQGRVVAAELTAISGLTMLFRPTPAAAERTLELFIANIRNPNTRRA